MNPAQSVPLASSLDVIRPSAIRELANVAFAMDDVFALHFGESTMPTPPYIAAALGQAVADGYTFYSPNAGLLSLRTALAEQAARLHGVTLDPAREVVVTASGTQALNVAIRCVLNPGDEALVLSPNWPNGAAMVAMFGATPVEVPLGMTPDMTSDVTPARFNVDFAALEAAVTPRTKLLLYTSPSNPLGWVATVDEQQQLLDFCRRYGLWLMADEVYERLFYGGPVAPSILRLCTRDDAVIVVQSFSKTYRMTGWRLGWLVSRADLCHKAAQLNEFIVSHAASMTQRAGEAALAQGEDDVAAMVELFGERMAFCHAALAAMPGVTVPKPEGAFYLFPRIEGVTDSFDFALRLLREEHVAVAPGVAFGKGGEGAIRICCASDMAVLEPAMARVGRFVGEEIGRLRD